MERLTRTISVRMTEEQYRALEREADRRGARMPDVVRWLASDLIVLERERELREARKIYERVEDIPPDEYREMIEGKWESPPGGKVEEALKRMNAEDWAIWSQRRLGE